MDPTSLANGSSEQVAMIGLCNITTTTSTDADILI